MTARAFCTISAAIKRSPDLGNGRTGAPTLHLSVLAITPLWPLDQRTIQQLDINSPREFKQCYHVPVTSALPDVREGDVLVVGSSEYPIDWVGEWTDGDVPCLHIVCQEIKGT